MLKSIWRKGNPLGQIQTGEAEWMWFKTLKTDLPFEPVIPLLSIYPNIWERSIQKETCTIMFISVLFTIAKLGKQPKYTKTDEWINMVWCIYTAEYYSAIKKT